MKHNGRARRRAELFEASLASGIGQALAGWASEYTHDLLEKNPELREQLRANWLLMFEYIAHGMADSQATRRRGRRRPSAR